MARPRMNGMFYFPMDTRFNDQIEALEDVQGNDGLVFIIKFWQKAYADGTGVVCLAGIWGERFCRRCRFSSGKLLEIIGNCLELELIYEKTPGFFASHGVEKRVAEFQSRHEKDRIRKENRFSNSFPTENDWKGGEKEKEKEKEKKKEEENNISHSTKFSNIQTPAGPKSYKSEGSALIPDELRSANHGKHLFKHSPISEFNKFKTEFPELSEELQIEWFQKASDYSDAHNAKYANWKCAIRNWIRMDKENKKTNQRFIA